MWFFVIFLSNKKQTVLHFTRLAEHFPKENVRFALQKYIFASNGWWQSHNWLVKIHFCIKPSLHSTLPSLKLCKVISSLGLFYFVKKETK